jgi:hypothetical protein
MRILPILLFLSSFIHAAGLRPGERDAASRNTCEQVLLGAQAHVAEEQLRQHFTGRFFVYDMLALNTTPEARKYFGVRGKAERDLDSLIAIMIPRPNGLEVEFKVVHANGLWPASRYSFIESPLISWHSSSMTEAFLLDGMLGMTDFGYHSTQNAQGVRRFITFNVDVFDGVNTEAMIVLGIDVPCESAFDYQMSGEKHYVNTASGRLCRVPILSFSRRTQTQTEM